MPKADFSAKSRASRQPVIKQKPVAPKNTRSTFMSHQDTTALIMVINGEMEAGKTFLMGSASDFWPRDKQGNSALPAKKMTTLEDMFWLRVDSRATAGFSAENITVETFDMFDYIAMNDVSIVQAINQGLKDVRSFVKDCRAKGLRPKIAVDTLSRLNYAVVHYFGMITSDNANKYEKFKAADIVHGKIDYELRRTGADIFFACHRKKIRADKDDGDSGIRIVGDAKFGPAVYGQAMKAHLWDEPLQVCVRAVPEKRGRNTIWHRKLLLDINNYSEQTKNRYRAILPAEMEADLGKVIQMINAGKRLDK